MIDEFPVTGIVNGEASGVYNVSLDKYEDFESGNYYPRLVLIAKSKTETVTLTSEETPVPLETPLSSVTATVPLTYTNADQPAALSSVTLSPGGNGTLKASWTKADDKADGYTVKILDGNANPVYSESGTPLTYNIANSYGDNGSFSVLLGGLKPGAEYYVEVIPYTNDSLLNGAAKRSGKAALPIPNYPVIIASFPGNVTENVLGDKVVFVTGSFGFNLSGNQADCKFTVLQDGKEITGASGSYSVDMTELSTSIIQITAENPAGDISYDSYAVYLDDVPPPLFVITDGNEVFTDKNGLYTVKGYSEAGAKISDDSGNTAEADENGSFALTGTLPAGEESVMRSVTAADSAGNGAEPVNVLIRKGEDTNPPPEPEPSPTPEPEPTPTPTPTSTSTPAPAPSVPEGGKGHD